MEKALYILLACHLAETELVLRIGKVTLIDNDVNHCIAPSIEFFIING
jgi:hypothetical protein